MPSGIALTNMLRQLGGAFGIAVMNTYAVSGFYAIAVDEHAAPGKPSF